MVPEATPREPGSLQRDRMPERRSGFITPQCRRTIMANTNKGRPEGTAQSVVDKAKDMASDAKDKVQDTAHSFSERAGDVASNVAHRTGEVASNVAHRAGE